MQGATCELIALGEWSPWARQLLNHWQEEEFINLSFENQISSFCQPTSSLPAVPQVVILENNKQSKQNISFLKSSNRDVLILWLGQSFTKEDLTFALENQIYACLENPSSNEKEIFNTFGRAAAACGQRQQGLHILGSLRQLIVQEESKNSQNSFTTELKTGLARIQKTLIPNELFQGRVIPAIEGSSLPLAQNQDLGDTLLTLFEFQRTGTLWVRGSLPHQEGKIDFLQGKITQAEAGVASQLKAVYRMFLWNNCRFLFSRKNPEDCPSDKMISMEMELIVHEGEAHRSRFKAIEHLVPPQHLKVDLVPMTLSTSSKLRPNEFYALIQAVEYHQVSDLLDYTERWDIDLYEGLISLKKSGFLKVLAS